MGMRGATEPGTEAHRWPTVIESCPLSAAPRAETLIPLTVQLQMLNSRILVILFLIFNAAVFCIEAMTHYISSVGK